MYLNQLHFPPPTLDNCNLSYDTNQEQTDHLRGGDQVSCLRLSPRELPSKLEPFHAEQL